MRIFSEKNLFAFAVLILILSLLFLFGKNLATLIWLPNFFQKDFLYGLDIAGGTILTYQADLSQTQRSASEVLEELKDLIERRVNVLGVSEVNISYTKSGKLIVEIPGFTDPQKAIAEIGQTPFLQFYLPVDATGSIFEPSKLTGEYVKKAEVQFNPDTFEPQVVVYFDESGKEIFADLTKKYLGRPIAIYLDNQEISRPVVRDVITQGVAVIEGRFTLEEARTLARRLNEGALPVPLKLIGQSVLHPTLGFNFLNLAVKAGILGLILIGIFLVIIYRMPGVLALLSLIFYAVYNLAIYKLLGVTISLGGIAGLILAIGIAVDADVLFFARLQEERRKTELPLKSLIESAFRNSWSSIRDSNIATLVSSFILYTFTVSFIKGFALTLFLGVLINLFLVWFVTRNLLLLMGDFLERHQKLLP